ncbi:MAG: VWA domain-containing protein [Labilithrix sp.]|nr:VWA domain-containing protein [Labilithrix sp.]
MADVRAPLRVIDELLWMLRRAGFEIATSQAIDAVRAVRAVGLGSRDDVRGALEAVIVKRARDRARFDATFDAFFAREPRRTLWERLAAEGFSEGEIDALREILDAIATTTPDAAIGPLVHRGAELDRLLQLAGSARMLDAMQSPLQSGFYVHRLLEHVGTWRARGELASLRVRLADAMGADRADALVAILEREVKLAAEDVRGFVHATLEKREADAKRGDDVLSAPFASLDGAEIEEVRRAVRVFVQRLRGGERVRRRRARKGRVDAHATLRRAMRTGGVPLTLARRARRRDKPRLVLLCDVSDSVRSVARFLLELTYSAQELFDRTRSFVFVSELGETTRLFAEEPIETALTRAYSGAVIPVTHNSSYGRVLRAFEERVLPDVDRRTTVVILGDGRTNYQNEGAEVLDAIRARARALVWLCPEARPLWATGDSAMSRYAPKCTKVLEVQSARDLEDAARLLLTLR